MIFEVLIMLYEENFDEICWSLEELKNFYLLLKAYEFKKKEFENEFSEAELKKCEKLLRDMAEQHTENYLNNFKIILK